MDKDLTLFCSILERETGLSFPISRYSFIMNRLVPLLEKYKINTLSELIVRSKQDIKLKIDIVNALTTNETWFFRHPEHFEIIKKEILPSILKRKKNKVINIWSAGCSIGAELYSILITIKEAISLSDNIRINIIGSDISYEAIQLAKKGIYDSYDLRMTDRNFISKYFDKIDDHSFRIKEELKHNVAFEFLNLLETWPARTYDIIFCRNTMIYFNEETKRKLIKRFFKALELEGYFFTSVNEMVDLNGENYGVKKLYIGNECVYQKTNIVTKNLELFFNNSTELLKATNLLRKISYSFHFGLPLKNSKGNEIRSLIISYSDSEKIIKYLNSYSLFPKFNKQMYR